MFFTEIKQNSILSYTSGVVRVSRIDISASLNPDNLAKNTFPRVVLIFKRPVKIPYSSLRLSWNLLAVISPWNPLNTTKRVPLGFKVLFLIAPCIKS